MTATDLPPATVQAIPRTAAPGGSHTTGNGHELHDTHGEFAVPGQTPETGHSRIDTHGRDAGLGPILADPLLGVIAEQVDDLERVRVATENRLRALTTVYGLTVEHPAVAAVAAMSAALAGQEAGAVRSLERVMREHPLGPWVTGTVGVGLKQAARLLAAISDPAWNDLHERPRTVSELWAYCGYHVLPPGGHVKDGTQGSLAAGVAPKHRRGQQGNWSDQARMRTHLIAAQVIRYRHSPYRTVYDEARAKYADAHHVHPCPQCGPKGKPAVAGTPLTPGHQHARALRIVAKQILKDLWIEAARLHQTTQAAAMGAAIPTGDSPLPGTSDVTTGTSVTT